MLQMKICFEVLVNFLVFLFVFFNMDVPFSFLSSVQTETRQRNK